MNLDRRDLALYALAATIPLSTAGQEVATGLALVVVLSRRGDAAPRPLDLPVLAVASLAALGSLAGGTLGDAIGVGWAFLPFVLLPRLCAAHNAPTAARVAVGATGAAALAAVVDAASGGDGRGLASHHLTTAYALLPALVAFASQTGSLAGWAGFLLVGAGIAATGSAGAAVAAPTALLALWTGRPGWSALAGAVATVIGLATFADGGELRQRAILWTGGLAVALRGPVGPGGYAAASTIPYDELAPGFWFPNHAHDGVVQALATLGPAGLVALGWLLWTVARLGPCSAAAVVGLAIGAATQDVFGDLEVLRALALWAAIEGQRRAPVG